MNIKTIIIICTCLLLSGYALSAEGYPVAEIPEDLKQGVNAVVRYEETSFVQSDLNTATESITKVITIFNEGGKQMADAFISQGRFLELKSFSGEIYLASGKLFQKIKKGDLITSAYSDHLAADDYVSFYSPSAPSYPYTVKYTYEVKWKNGLAYYPSFMPIGNFGCAVEKSVLKLQIPANLIIRFKGNDLAIAPIRERVANDSIFTFICENLHAIAREPMCPSIQTLVPVVLAAPSEFCFDKVCGNMSSWKGVGMFLTQLQAERTNLLPETIAKLQEMTASAKDENEKVKILYEYLQDKTRYVSIQLGIGGWQPLPAKQVDATSFGDCKALVNYMKSMLTAVNIQSEYAIIHTNKERMYPDFSTPTQANHVVLFVPMANDSVWLECTNRDLPYAYAHSDMAGHDVLLVAGEKSKLYTVPEIPDSLHTETNAMSLKLHADASGTSLMKHTYTNHKTEDFLRFVLYKPENEKINDLAENLSVNKAKISNIHTGFQKQANPEVTITYDMQAEKYANQTGSRMFVSLNPFRNSWSRNFSASSRKLPIHIRAVAHRTDTISIELPEGYVVETMPQPILLDSEFGRFTSSVESVNNRLIIVQRIRIHKGRYAAEQYQEMKNFFQKIDASLSGRVVLKKQAS